MINTANNPKEVRLPFQKAAKLNNRWNCEFDSKAAGARSNNKNNWRTKEREVLTVISPVEKKYREAEIRIKTLCNNSNKLEGPNSVAQGLALNALDILKEKDLFPTIINSSQDESLIFEFFVKGDTYSIDFCNSGEILYLSRIKDQVLKVAEISEEELKGAIAEISHAYANL